MIIVTAFRIASGVGRKSTGSKQMLVDSRDILHKKNNLWFMPENNYSLFLLEINSIGVRSSWVLVICFHFELTIHKIRKHFDRVSRNQNQSTHERRDQDVITISVESDWLRGWRELSTTITDRSLAKAMHSRITSDIQFTFTHINQCNSPDYFILSLVINNLIET